MITLNNKSFALNNDEFIDVLIDSDVNCVGYYKPMKHEIKLMDTNKVKVGVITKSGVLALATKRPKGWWYSYGTIDLIGEYDFSQQTDDIRVALTQLNTK